MTGAMSSGEMHFPREGFRDDRRSKPLQSHTSTRNLPYPTLCRTVRSIILLLLVTCKPAAGRGGGGECLDACSPLTPRTGRLGVRLVFVVVVEHFARGRLHDGVQGYHRGLMPAQMAHLCRRGMHADKKRCMIAGGVSNKIARPPQTRVESITCLASTESQSA